MFGACTGYGKFGSCPGAVGAPAYGFTGAPAYGLAPCGAPAYGFGA